MSFYEDANKVGKEAIDNTLKSFSAVSKGFQQLAAETTDYTKQSYEQSSQALEKLAQAKSFDRAFEVQTEFAKSAYERWVAQATKVSELVSDIAKESYRPFENTVASAANAAPQAARKPN